MDRIIARRFKDERGAATIMEATVVFPVMIVVIVFLLYLGNGMYQMSRVTSAVARYAVDGAAMCTDPYYYDVAGKDKAPTTISSRIEPYRYMLKTDNSHITSIEHTIEEKVKQAVNKHGYFLGMKPQVTNVDVHYNNQFFYSTFSVEVNYKIKMGVKLIGQSDYSVINSSAYSEVAVNDPADFIRNTDMVIDYIEGTEKGAKAVSKLTEAFNKVKDFLKL